MEQVYSLEEVPAIMTVPEFGKFLGIGRSQAYALAHSGRVETLKVGKQIKIPRHAVLKFIGALT